MKLTFCCLLAVFVLAAEDKPAGQKPAASKAPARPAAKKAKAPAALTLPPEAVEIELGTYRYTDPQGKKWIYRKTPFGLVRYEDQPEPAGTPAASAQTKETDQITAVEDGDTIRFERPGPFGLYKWQRKKSELNAMEQAVWDREREKRAARETAKQE